MIAFDFSRIAPWRRRLQWLTSLTILIIPFIQIGDRSLLRLNIPARALDLFGARFRIEELYLFLLVCLAGILLFLVLTMVLGRVWCGWGCPQTTLVDLVEGVARRLKLKPADKGFSGPLYGRVLLQLLYLFLALLVGANLVWYSIPPAEFFSRLVHGDLGMVASLTLLTVAAIVWIDLAFLRRTLCKEFCPYGRFQTTLVDPGTLTLHFHPDEASRCISCNACVRSCPTGIDIRRGFQIECINCGRCLDACRDVMARRDQAGIIRYTFGTESKGPAALLNIRVLMVSVALLLISVIIVVSIMNRSLASLKVRRSSTISPQVLKTGEFAVFYTGFVKNQSGEQITLSIAAFDPSGQALELRGPVDALVLDGGERQRIDFLLLVPAEKGPLSQAFLELQDPADRPLDRAELTLPAPQESS